MALITICEMTITTSRSPTKRSLSNKLCNHLVQIKCGFNFIMMSWSPSNHHINDQNCQEQAFLCQLHGNCDQWHCDLLHWGQGFVSPLPAVDWNIQATSLRECCVLIPVQICSKYIHVHPLVKAMHKSETTFLKLLGHTLCSLGPSWGMVTEISKALQCVYHRLPW